jgi:sugar O-acyltransferase (sialic acid O-acetyltransferase NeuD family)
MKPRAVCFGAGGHARVAMEIAIMACQWDVIALLEVDAPLMERTFMGFPVRGEAEALAHAKEERVEGFFLGVGTIAGLALRSKLFQKGLLHGMEPISLIHPAATVSRFAVLGGGVFVGASSAVNAAARLGENTCVNTGAIVEHDCVIGSHSFVGPGAILGGGVAVGEFTLIGMGATVLPGVRIGSNATVGAGSVVVHDVVDGAKVIGVPARRIA